MNILIVDVDTDTTNQLVNLINQSCQDWHVSVTNSGCLCLEALRNRNCPDIIILGRDLSDISGLELVELIRDDSDVPVVFLSDSKDIQTLVKAFDKGVTDYIVKPFSGMVFLARLKAIARRRAWDIKIEDAHAEGFEGIGRVNTTT